MWRALCVEHDKLLMKHYNEYDKQIICLTDVKDIWIEEISSSSLIQRCKDENPLIEADDDALLKHIFSIMDDDDNTFKSQVNYSGRSLEIVSKTAGVPFRLTFNLLQRDSAKLYTELTLPLLLLVHTQETLLSKLYGMLEAKDVEITQYKLEGAELKRKKVETEPFSKEMFHREAFGIYVPSTIPRDPLVLFTNSVCKNLMDIFRICMHSKHLILQQKRGECQSDFVATQCKDGLQANVMDTQEEYTKQKVETEFGDFREVKEKKRPELETGINTKEQQLVLHQMAKKRK